MRFFFSPPFVASSVKRLAIRDGRPAPAHDSVYPVVRERFVDVRLVGRTFVPSNRARVIIEPPTALSNR